MFFIKRFRKVVRTYSSLKGPQKDYLQNKNAAHQLVIKQLELFNVSYKFQYKRISIKNQRTRWGSCSKAGNLNFHYKIILLPESFSNYIIVHELCHLKQFDHSKAFWDLVSKTIPNHKEIRKRLRENKYIPAKNG
jgi:predicted metal-dependent hydrolase